MLANCLTKAGVSAEQLMKVLQTGHYVMPSCLEAKGGDDDGEKEKQWSNEGEEGDEEAEEL